MRAANGNERPAAEHAHATDRFAREIVPFLKVIGGALAAADGQTVGRLVSVVDIPFLALIRRSRFSHARCASSVVPKPVVLAWFGRSWCGLPVVQVWYEHPLCGAPVIGSLIVCWA